MTFDDFEQVDIEAGQARIHVRMAGEGAPVLLLHGFPETSWMWREVAPRLAEGRLVLCADLRGFGDSSCPPSTADHSPYAKRTMADDMVEVMTSLGQDRFDIAGHDRGGRVAYRLALDHPDRVLRLAVLDIVPTSEVWARADARISSFWPWILLSQPEPLPERLLAADPEAVIESALDGWGSRPEAFDRRTRQVYADALGDPEHIHAICEEYRAAAGLDILHDLADRRTGVCIRCPLLALWSAEGAVGQWYREAGGPLAVWRDWADEVAGEAIDAGHFFPEEAPELTADRLASFFG